MLARMMRLTRKLCRQRPSLRYDSRVQAIGPMVVVIVPFFIRKDAYLDIYLLLPLTFGFLAARGFRNGARGAVKTGPVSAPVRSEARRVGKKCFRTCRSRGWPSQ